jgi:hypothetical protein
MIKIGKLIDTSSLWTKALPTTGLDLFCKQDGLERQRQRHPKVQGLTHLLTHLFSANNLEPVRQDHELPNGQSFSHSLVQDFSLRRIP